MPAHAQVAIHHRKKTRRRLRRPEPERARVCGLRDIKVRRDKRIRRPSELQRLPFADRTGERCVVSRTIQRRHRPRRDGVRRRVVECPIRDRQPRARTIYLIPDACRRSRPAPIGKSLRRPSRAQRSICRHEKLRRRCRGDQVLPIHHRPLAEADVRTLRGIRREERWERTIRLSQREKPARIIREREVRVQLRRRILPIFS